MIFADSFASSTDAFRPATISEAIWHALTNRRLVAIYGLTFAIALAIPFAVKMAMRKWRERKTEKEQKEQTEQEDEFDSTRGHSMGTFNRSILNSLSHFEIGRGKSVKNEYKQFGTDKNIEQSPFVPRESIEEIANKENKNSEKEEDIEEEKEPLLSAKGGEAKKKKTPRKKYKDPDPETVKELKKLTERGLHGKVATAQLRTQTKLIEEQMSEEEREKEQNARQNQLEAIFKMMEGQKEKFGINDQAELKEQMKMYSI